MASWRDGVRRSLRTIEPYAVEPAACTVKLDANESPYGPPRELLEEVGRELLEEALHRYPDPRATALRAAIAADLGQPGERLVLGNGSDELIALLCCTFAEPRAGLSAATMVYPSPSFVVYRTAALAAGMEVVEAPLGPHFEATPAALEEAIATSRPTLVFVATPNNPTGTVWPTEPLEALVRSHPDTVIVIDEAYCAYNGSDHSSFLRWAPNCAILRTYSKIGLAGLRIGVLIAQPPLAYEVEKVRAPYNVGVLPLRAATLAITRYCEALTAHVTEVVAERTRLQRELARLPGLELFPSGANLLLVRVRDAEQVWRELVARSILVRNLDRPGALKGCLRITVGRPDENRLLVAALREILT